MNEETPITIETISVLAKLSDGTVRQVLLQKQTQQEILDVIVAREGTIKVFDAPLEGIEFTKAPDHKPAVEDNNLQWKEVTRQFLYQAETPHGIYKIHALRRGYDGYEVYDTKGKKIIPTGLNEDKGECLNTLWVAQKFAQEHYDRFLKKLEQ